jgi:hypothetical protein
LTVLVALGCGISACISQTFAAEWVPLGPQQEALVRRFLHPLPHELRLKGQAFHLRAGECSLDSADPGDPVAQQMIGGFASRWLERTGVELQKERQALHIAAVLVGASSSLEGAAKQGLIETKYLRERRNPEQAYTLVTQRDGERAMVVVAANRPPGIYYGLLTLEQLLTSLSKKDEIILPEASVVDWPDIGLRGSWSALEHVGNDAKALPMYDAQLRALSAWRLNFAEGWHLTVDDKLDEKGRLKVNWTHPKEVVDMGLRYGMRVFPGTGHLPGRTAHSAAVKERFPDIAGIPAQPERKVLSLCYQNPGTQEFINEYLESIARQFDFAHVWMTELEGVRGVCHCTKCKGYMRQAFVSEVQHILRACERARAVNPKFRIQLGLTQGSYPHQYEVLQHVPKDVPITFYNGKITYRSYFQTYNLPPSAQEMKRLGYQVGMCPSPAETFWYQPFRTPKYCKLLAGEAEDLGLEYILFEMYPSPVAHDFNAQALAEFLWNSAGRTPEEFTVAWATRRGLANPEETAAIIGLMEYPVRGLHNVSLKDLVAAGVNLVSGKERATTSLFGEFEYRTYAEMKRVLDLCEEGIARAKALNNPELLAGCVLVRGWMAVLERYAWCIGRPEAEQRPAVEAIRAELRKLPELHKAWLDFQNFCPSSPSRHEHIRKIVDRFFEGLRAQWEPILSQPPESPEFQVLELARQEGRLEVLPLGNTWKFAPAADNKSDAEAAADFRDKEWAEVRSDQGFGWEKQGFAGYTGYGWYRQRVKVPEPLTKKRFVYLLCLAVDEDAEVFLNGKKAFTHSHATVGGLPGSTWDRPFSFDAKSYLDPKGAMVVAVRVFNRQGMGGIWKPVYVVASDAEAKTEALVMLVSSEPEGEE